MRENTKGDGQMIGEQARHALAEVGLDVDEAVARFMDSEDMFRRFFAKFFESAEAAVQQLKEDAQSDNFAQAERSAHALKGLAGNMGLNAVFEPAQKIVSDIRAGKTCDVRADAQRAITAYEQAKQAQQLL